jgi:quinol monooxygenase YgiN
VFLIGTRSADEDDLLLTITAATPRPVQIGFDYTPSAAELRHAIDEAVPAEGYFDDVMPMPVSAVISTRIKPGQEEAYLQWGRKIAEAQAKSPGFQGYRREPPVPGVQEDWLTILRSDSEANLQTWLDSPERKKLLEESEAFTDECHTRIVRTGFDQWFEVPGAAPPSAWKTEHGRADGALSACVSAQPNGCKSRSWSAYFTCPIGSSSSSTMRSASSCPGRAGS